MSPIHANVIRLRIRQIQNPTCPILRAAIQEQQELLQALNSPTLRVDYFSL